MGLGLGFWFSGVLGFVRNDRLEKRNSNDVDFLRFCLDDPNRRVVVSQLSCLISIHKSNEHVLIRSFFIIYSQFGHVGSPAN